MSMRIEQVSGPASQAVSLSEVKDQLGLIGDARDAFLLSLASAAARYVEHYTQSRLVTQVLRLHGETFGPLPVYPLQSVDSVAYDDADDVEQTIASSDYWVRQYGMWPELRPVETWPDVMPDKPGCVRITVTVGYSEVPADIKQAILLRVKELYANRGESIPGMGGIVALSPVTLKALLQPYRRIML